jgi:hypothetical protein
VNLNGTKIRRGQIARYIFENFPQSYVVLDDLDLEMDKQVITHPKKGLSAADVRLASKILNGEA